MTAYLKWRGMLETTLSLYRAAGALAGIGATLCFSALHARLGVLSMQPGLSSTLDTHCQKLYSASSD